MLFVKQPDNMGVTGAGGRRAHRGPRQGALAGEVREEEDGGEGVKIYMTENEGCFAFDMTA